MGIKMIIRQLIVFLIKFYQKAVSPYLGNNCRFHPTCSQYAIECFQIFPLHKALFLSIKRVLKCHPFHPGGDDPVIKK